MTSPDTSALDTRFIDDNPIFDDMPYMECPTCHYPEVTYNNLLSVRINKNRLNHLIKTVPTVCQCRHDWVNEFNVSVIEAS